MRELKDFAIMLMLSNDGEIFWKWHLTSDEAAELLIKKQLGMIQEEKPGHLKEKPLESFEKKTPEAPKQSDNPNINPSEKDIEKIAANAAEITTYFKDVLVNHPEALRPPPQVVEKIIEKEKIIQKEFGTKFRPIGALVITAAFLGALGLAAASAYFLSHPNEGDKQEF